MSPYSVSDAIRDLSPVLDDAPPGAIAGEWIATTMQAGTASRTGAYTDAEGQLVPSDSPNATSVLDLIGDIIEKLETSLPQRFNKLTIRWQKAATPHLLGLVTLETEFDETIVPRGPNDPIYEAAAATRLAFWKARGEVQVGFAAERGEANFYNQTKWGGPHHRVLAIRTVEKLTLATDGLSTPWAGTTAPWNGEQCELFMEFDIATMNDELIDDWAHLLISLGDLLAEDAIIPEQVEQNGAILFCTLTKDYSPMTRIILSRDGSQIADLPFGAVPLIRATPIAEIEIEGQDLSDSWSAHAATNALARRHIAIPLGNNQAT